MAGLENISQRPVVLNARTGQPVTQEQYDKLSQISLKSASNNKLARMPEQDKVFDDTDKGEKVSLKEGIKLVSKGFIGKIWETCKAIVKHPVKTLGLVAATTIGLTALPLIGMSSLTGAAILAVGFASIATFKVARDIIKAVKDNREGDNNALRKDLKNIGGDGLDLVLSLPFVPKGIQQIRNQFKYVSGVKFNSTLWNTVKETKGIWSKLKELTKADIEMLYKIHIKELGLKVSPDLKFVTMPKGQGGSYNFQTGELCINTNDINPLFINGINSNLRHELTHFKQATEISRLNNGISQLESVFIHRIHKPEIEMYREELNIQLESKTQQQSILEKGSKEAETLDTEIAEIKEVLGLLDTNPKKAIMIMRPSVISQLEAYLNALRQQNAPAAQIAQQEQVLKYYIADLTSINAALYERAIQENHGGQLIVQGSKEEASALGYLEGRRNYPKNVKILSTEYLLNPLEKEAYIKQIKYMLNRPDNLTNIAQGLTNIADKPKE